MAFESRPMEIDIKVLQLSAQSQQSMPISHVLATGHTGDTLLTATAGGPVGAAETEH